MKIQPKEFHFKNIDEVEIKATFRADCEGLDIIEAGQPLNNRVVRFRFSLPPERKDNTEVELLFRELMLLAENEREFLKCESFKLYDEEEWKESNDSEQRKVIHVKTLKFGYGPYSQAIARGTSVALGVLGLGFLIVGGGGVAAGVAASGFIGTAFTTGSHGFFSSEIDYSHHQCVNDSSKSLIVNSLAGTFGAWLNQLPALQQAGQAIATKLPYFNSKIVAKTVTQTLAAAGVTVTVEGVDVIKDWHNGKSFKLSKLTMRVIASAARTAVAGGVARSLKAEQIANGIVERNGFHKVFEKTTGAFVGGATRQGILNISNGQSSSENIVSSAFSEAGTALVHSGIKQIGKTIASPNDLSTDETPIATSVNETLPTPDQEPPTPSPTPILPQETPTPLLTKEQNWSNRLVAFGNQYGSYIDDYIKNGAKWKNPETGKWTKFTQENKLQITSYLMSGVRIHTKDGAMEGYMGGGKQAARDWTQFLQKHNQLPSAASIPAITPTPQPALIPAVPVAPKLDSVPPTPVAAPTTTASVFTTTTQSPISSPASSLLTDITTLSDKRKQIRDEIDPLQEKLKALKAKAKQEGSNEETQVEIQSLQKKIEELNEEHSNLRMMQKQLREKIKQQRL